MKQLLRQGTAAQCGVSLVEMMVSIALSLMVVLAATTVLLASKSGHTSVDETTRLQDAGRYALDIISRNVRQTAYEQWDRTDAPIVVSRTFTPSIIGLDGQTLGATSEAMLTPQTPGGIKSDVLALRFFGSSDASGADGTVLNCAGYAVPAPTSVASADAERAWSIFYVKESSSGEPELRCKYRSASGWASDAIVPGVESFQVLYGLDTSSTTANTSSGMPTRFLRASAIDALDNTLTLTGDTDAAKALDKLRQSHWKKVVAVKIALLMRGTLPTRLNDPLQFDLFDAKYAGKYAGVDLGTSVVEGDLRASERDRLRKIFSATILLRNHVAGSGT